MPKNEESNIRWCPGEYAESVYDSMAKEEYDLIGFVDEYKKGYHMGKPILAATIEEVFNFRDYAYFISIGDTEPRKRQFEVVKRLGLDTINIIDKTALISDSVKIGTGQFHWEDGGYQYWNRHRRQQHGKLQISD